MLAADAQADVGAGLPAQLHGHGHQLAHAGLVQMGEGIGLVDLGVVVVVQELARVIPAEAEGHLGQVVGAEGEELGLPGHLVGGEGGLDDSGLYSGGRSDVRMKQTDGTVAMPYRISNRSMH